MNKVGKTTDNRPVVGGVFVLVGTHGIPLEVVLEGLKQRGLVPCWPTYICDAMADGAKPRTISARITAAVGEVYGPDHLKEVEVRLEKYLQTG